MSPYRKVTRNWREGEGTPSRHSRLGARAAALIVLGGVVGLSSAPMAHAAAHDSLKTFRSSGTFTVAKDDADVDAAEDRSEARDEAEDRSEARDEAEDRSEAKGDDDDRSDFKNDEGDWAEFFDDGFQIIVVVNNNNNNNNGANANNNNNNNNGARTANNANNNT